MNITSTDPHTMHCSIRLALNSTSCRNHSLSIETIMIHDGTSMQPPISYVVLVAIVAIAATACLTCRLASRSCLGSDGWSLYRI
jgi:hypothetical protein